MRVSKDAQILELQSKAVGLLEHNKNLEQRLKNEESAKQCWYKKSNEFEEKLSEIHDLLDVLPDPVPRKTGTDEDADYKRRERSVTERLVAYLVRR